MAAVDICNIALSRISVESITSLSSSNKSARECNRIYETVRNAVLADHDWSFARKRKTLSLLTDTYDGWDYAYSLPTDCLTPRKLYDSAGSEEPLAYEVAVNDDLDGKVLLTDEEDAILIYTAKVTDSNLFEPHFIDAFATRLASDLSLSIRGDSNLSQMLLQVYFAYMGRAKDVSSNADKKKVSDTSCFLRARQ